MHQFTHNRFHYNWHWFWDYGNGDLGNQGIHEVDIARWGLGVKYPTKVSAIGGHFMFDDDQETPNTLNCAFEFNENGKQQDDGVRSAPLDDQPRSRHRPSGGKGSNTIGNLFYGSKGYLAIDRLHEYKTCARQGTADARSASQDEGGDHFVNFIEAVRSRKRET